ncbi:MAG: redox-regulated ATPase YchF [Planctomycetes bacterium]|nr:redox-regulated ATPase YchF [Planctomycetota bacterium]
MKLGILGLPGSGKSTLFDLLTECFEGPDFSHAPNKPRVRSVKVRDSRLERLRDDYKPHKFTPASFELYDFPARAKEGSRTGLADLLAPARELDTLFLVIRGFQVPGGPPPAIEADVEEILGELVLADLVVVEKRLERLEEKSHKANYTDADRRERELLGTVLKRLEAEERLSGADLSSDEWKSLGGFGFLSAKPLVVALSAGESLEGLPVEAVREKTGSEVVATCARNELEILQLPEDEQAVFREEYDIHEPTRDRLVAEGYRAAGRISFFTAGEKEVRAWTITQGMTALEAAGTVHTDMARGFIRAETVSFRDYLECGSVKKAREKGLLRLEGKEYVVQDADILEFRFSV